MGDPAQYARPYGRRSVVAIFMAGRVASSDTLQDQAVALNFLVRSSFAWDTVSTWL